MKQLKQSGDNFCSYISGVTNEPTFSQEVKYMLSLYESNNKSILGKTSMFGYKFGANKSPFMLYPKNGTVKTLNRKSIQVK